MSKTPVAQLYQPPAFGQGRMTDSEGTVEMKSGQQGVDLVDQREPIKVSGLQWACRRSTFHLSCQINHHARRGSPDTRTTFPLSCQINHRARRGSPGTRALDLDAGIHHLLGHVSRLEIGALGRRQCHKMSAVLASPFSALTASTALAVVRLLRCSPQTSCCGTETRKRTAAAASATLATSRLRVDEEQPAATSGPRGRECSLPEPILFSSAGRLRSCQRCGA